MSVCLPAEHPVEIHTAVDAGAAGPYGVAICSPAVSGDAEPHGWCPEHGGQLWNNWQRLSTNQSCPGSRGAEACPIRLFHLGSPVGGGDHDETLTKTKLLGKLNICWEFYKKYN